MRNKPLSIFIAVVALSLPMAALAQPSITQVQNNYSYLVAGQPNYGIAPGTLFIVVGTGMASTTTVSSLESSNAPGLPTTLNGASVSVTVKGVTTTPGFYYAEATQLALVLPAATPAGPGTINVNFGGQTASAPITVLQSALGFDTLYGTGTGLGVVTPNNSVTPFNYTNSAEPGELVVFWGSGLGADPADSDTVFTGTPHAINVPLTIYIGGISADIVYQGASGYPGVNQLDVTVPAGVQPGCGVSVVAVSGSIVSNTITLPVNPGGGVCSDPVLGVTGSEILTIGSKATYNSGTITLDQATTASAVQDVVLGTFESEQGSQSASGAGYVSAGNCIVSSSAAAVSSFVPTALDAGTLTITGPTGTQTVIERSLGSYSLRLPAGFIPASGGSFTFNATGGTTPGASVGAFTTTLNFGAPLVWSNMSSITAINRAQGQTISWTGGASNSFVIIEGSSNSAATGVSVGFTCFAAVSAGQFTIPSYILETLPAGAGSLEVGSEIGRQAFSASGLDSAFVDGLTGASVNLPYN
jgi:uncharacterized protein (TIGR03437 family)